MERTIIGLICFLLASFNLYFVIKGTALLLNWAAMFICYYFSFTCIFYEYTKYKLKQGAKK